MHPIAFDLYGFKITSFGLMLALAFLFGWMYTLRQTRRTQWFKEEDISDLLVWLMIGGVVGARVLYVIVHWSDTFAKAPLQALNFRAGGMVSYGGFIGAFLAGYIFTRRHKLDFFQLADLCLPGALLGQSIGRIGCFLVGDDYGRPAPGLPWAVTFPKDPDSMLPRDLQGQELHPTQLYMCFKAFVCFLILRYFLLHRSFKGQVFAAALITYPLFRAIVEIYRYDSVERGVYFGLSTAQWLAIPAILFGITFWVRNSGRAATS